MKRLLYAVVCISLLACSNPMTWTRDSTANMKSNNGVYVTVICDGVPIKETASINLNK